MANLRAELDASPPLAGAYTPKRGDLCVAKFIDGLWYRARVEKVDKDKKANVLYVDYGNRDSVPAVEMAPLPSSFHAMPAQAKEYRLAFTQLPPDVSHSNLVEQGHVCECSLR